MEGTRTHRRARSTQHTPAWTFHSEDTSIPVAGRRLGNASSVESEHSAATPVPWAEQSRPGRCDRSRCRAGSTRTPRDRAPLSPGTGILDHSRCLLNLSPYRELLHSPSGSRLLIPRKTTQNLRGGAHQPKQTHPGTLRRDASPQRALTQNASSISGISSRGALDRLRG